MDVFAARTREWFGSRDPHPPAPDVAATVAALRRSDGSDWSFGDARRLLFVAWLFDHGKVKS